MEAPNELTQRDRVLGRERPFPLDLIAFSDSTAQRVRWGAWGWTSIRTPIFLALALSEGIPQSPERAIWEAPLQLGLLVLVDIGSLVAWRLQGIGATMITVGAVLLGVLAAMERQPLQGLAVATAFIIPGVLYWLDWQRTQPIRVVLLLAVALVMLLVVGGLAAYLVHASYNGSSGPGILWSIGRMLQWP